MDVGCTFVSELLLVSTPSELYHLCSRQQGAGALQRPRRHLLLIFPIIASLKGVKEYDIVLVTQSLLRNTAVK